MQAPFVVIRSALPGVVWPAIARPQDAAVLALQYQLERSQWLSAETLLELQFRQLAAVLAHAYETVPYYRWQWHGIYEPDTPPAPASFARLPVLAREDLQMNFDALKSGSVPPAHGRIVESRPSDPAEGSASTLKTDLVELWWRAITLRDHLWHRRDFTGKLAAIRHGVGQTEQDGWGAATEAIALNGRSATLPVTTEVGAQVDWLIEQQPDYFLSYPAVVSRVARLCIERGVRLERLREIRTIGEPLTQEVRELCRRAWGVPATGLYSSDEAGYMALQCPEAEHYHVQSESLVLEVLDVAGNACLPGSVGRVVVTTLHNFAMPLVRYDTGDDAEVGPPCGCGRGLPVLRKVVKRAQPGATTAS